MSDDIATRLTISGGHSPSECWSCGEWGCRNSEREYVPCLCYDDDSCSHDNNCDCDCHEWYGIVIDAKAEIERLREALIHCRHHNHPTGECELCDLYEQAYRGE